MTRRQAEIGPLPWSLVLSEEGRHPPGPRLASRPASRLRCLSDRVQHRTPHQLLGGTPPGAHYRNSPRPYPARLPTPDYPGHYLVKRVTTSGTIRFRDRFVFLAKPLIGERIGLDEIADGIWPSIS